MRKFLLIIVLPLLSACSEEVEPLPPDVLTEEAFVPVMTEMMLLEAVQKQRMLQDEDIQKSLSDHYARLFKKHNTTETQFRASFAYWSEHPEAMMRIYDRCLAALDLPLDNKEAPTDAH